MLKQLFDECAFRGNWQVAGEDTDYKFIEQDNTLYIYFKGSDSDFDWKMNFIFTKKVYKMFRVHKGFYKEYCDVRSIILDRCYSKDYEKIIIVGYSLGGALCQLALEDILWHFPTMKIIGYAFESPRCLKVKKEHRHLWNGLIRIVNGNDIVCHLPPRIFGFSDLGNEIKIKGDTKLVKNKLPCFIKYHFPQCVYDGLEKLSDKSISITERGGK